MSTTDQISYLNRNTKTDAGQAFFSRLVRTIRESKQGKAPAAQWLSMILAFTQKGVKAQEIKEAGFTPFLEAAGTQVLTKDALLEEVARRYYTIKEVVLGTPKYGGWHQPGGKYKEYLYIANSERDNVVDAIAAIEFEMEDFNFNPVRLAEDPAAVIALEMRREELLKQKGLSIDFTSHHFSDRINGSLGRNLLAHCRVTEREDTYFIEEIQSDWAQGGRRAHHHDCEVARHRGEPEPTNWRRYPEGPLVTNTEAWAGMVLRRHLQIAASMPNVKRVAWITGSMRNGGAQTLTTNEAGHRVDSQQGGLNDFYLKVVPKLAEKALGKCGVKPTMLTLALGERNGTPNTVVVPGFEMTDAARQQLAAPQPLYSRALVDDALFARVDAVRAAAVGRAVASAKEMLGSARHLRLAKHVYDIASGAKVAGRYANGLIQVALNAHDIEEVADHETWHFASDKLLTQAERVMVERDFAPGAELNFRVREALTRRGMFKAASQCVDPEEAAAHGFALWKRGHISMTERPVQGLFSEIATAVRDCCRWLRRVALEQKHTTSEQLFNALAAGELARERMGVAAGAAPRKDEQELHPPTDASMRPSAP